MNCGSVFAVDVVLDLPFLLVNFVVCVKILLQFFLPFVPGVLLLRVCLLFPGFHGGVWTLVWLSFLPLPVGLLVAVA